MRANFKIDKIIKSPKDKSGRLTRIYINPTDETLYENYTSGRFTRPHEQFRKSGLLDVILEGEMGYGESKPKAKWSQKAGCSCNCSPAFIIEGEKSKEYAYDIFVDYDSGVIANPPTLELDVIEVRARALYESLGLTLDVAD